MGNLKNIIILHMLCALSLYPSSIILYIFLHLSNRRSNNFYFALLLTMLFLCVLPVGYAIVWVEPSWHCGPFSGYPKIYNLATQTLINSLPQVIQRCVSPLFAKVLNFTIIMSYKMYSLIDHKF